MKIVFAGTKNGRDFVTELLKGNEEIIVSTATEYGASLYEAHDHLTVISGKMDEEMMKSCFLEKGITEIIDATHPYAVNVSENLKKCAEFLGIGYKQLARDSYLEAPDDEGLLWFENYPEICEYLHEKEGNILLTIGSNNLHQFAGLNRKKKVYARVLPTSSVLKKCEDLGFSPGNILALQGPFSEELNQAMYQEYQIKYMVTKDSGSIGGVREKILPALKMGIQVLILKRP